MGYTIEGRYHDGPGGVVIGCGSFAGAVTAALRARGPGGDAEHCDWIDIVRDSGRETVDCSAGELRQWLAEAPDLSSNARVTYRYYAWAQDGEGITPMFENRASSAAGFASLMDGFFARHPNPGRLEITEVVSTTLGTLERGGTQRWHPEVFGDGETMAVVRTAQRGRGEAPGRGVAG